MGQKIDSPIPVNLSMIRLSRISMVHPLLEYYVKEAEEIKLGISMTINVKGVVIQGITMSQKEYYEDFWTLMSAGKPTSEANKPALDKVNTRLHDFIKTQTDDKKQRTDPEYIYLRNARLYSDSPDTFIGVGPWAGKLSEVDGFSISQAGGPS
jgi:hypothetical protein